MPDRLHRRRRRQRRRKHRAVPGPLPDQVALLQPVTKGVFAVQHVGEIPGAVRQAFHWRCAASPARSASSCRTTCSSKSHDFDCRPAGAAAACRSTRPRSSAPCTCSRDRRLRVGIYAGMGCMDYSADAGRRLAELLQAPVATSVSGKGVIPECHPLAVGWGYGPQGTRTAEKAFKQRRPSSWPSASSSARSRPASTRMPQHAHLIHVDANPTTSAG